jgi:hypothetical protein
MLASNQPHKDKPVTQPGPNKVSPNISLVFHLPSVLETFADMSMVRSVTVLNTFVSANHKASVPGR